MSNGCWGLSGRGQGGLYTGVVHGVPGIDYELSAGYLREGK